MSFPVLMMLYFASKQREIRRIEPQEDDKVESNKDSSKCDLCRHALQPLDDYVVKVLCHKHYDELQKIIREGNSDETAVISSGT